MRRCVRTGDIDECESCWVSDRPKDRLGDFTGDVWSELLPLLPARENAGEFSWLKGGVDPFVTRSGCPQSSSLKLVVFMLCGGWRMLRSEEANSASSIIIASTRALELYGMNES